LLALDGLLPVSDEPSGPGDDRKCAWFVPFVLDLEGAATAPSVVSACGCALSSTPLAEGVRGFGVDSSC